MFYKFHSNHRARSADSIQVSTIGISKDEAATLKDALEAARDRATQATALEYKCCTRDFKVLVFARSCLAVFIGLAAVQASAESLRCSSQSVSEGDSRLSVFYKCGEPLLKDTHCAPIYAQGSIRPVPEPFASLLFPCVQVEEWLYDRGPGNLLATVRFQSGVVHSITYGRSPH